VASTFDSKEIARIAEAERAWKEDVLKPELARKGERKKPVLTRSGILVDNLYTPASLPDYDYLNEDGFPGDFPFTRGVDPNMYRSQLWTFGQYAGFGTAEETNQRFKYLIAQGGTGLSIALDLPTQMGYDADHPLASGEVGKVGVSICSLQDMEILLDGIPLTKIRQMRTTANAIGHIILAMWVAVAEKQGIDPNNFSALLQNDPLKEYIGRGTFIYPPKPALRLSADVIEYCARNLPNWTAINISGYHIRESGATASQEIAFTFANAREYCEETLRRGVPIDTFAPVIWVFFATQMDLLEEVAKYRAARRMWAHMMRDRYGAQNPRSMQLRFLSFSAGSALTAQQPLNNIVRVTIQTLAAALAGIQTHHASSYDEALSLPSEEAVRMSLRIQQIVAEESGVTNTVDPLGGSFYVETLTRKIEEEANRYLDKIEALGGAVSAIEQGYIQREIAEAAYQYQQRVERKELIIVGVNEYLSEEAITVPPFRVDPTVRERQIAKLQRLRATRNAAEVEAALTQVRDDAAAGRNIVPATLRAVKAYATVGEICDVLRSVFGGYRDPGHL
jgi:methylmalonyl-CoA mutase N-terminal domain/subunit